MTRRDESGPGEANGGRTFVLVGHCLPDEYMLMTAIGRAVQGAAIERANDHAALDAHLHGGAVLLVNRVLEGAFRTESGIELIGKVVNGGDSPVCLLISNYQDAQARAVAAGARPGFGKGDLYRSETADMLRAAAGLA